MADNPYVIEKRAFDSLPDRYHRIYTAIWQNVNREDELINHRLTWSIVLSGAILTAQSFLANAAFHDIPAPNEYVLRSIYSGVMFILSFSSAFFCFLTRSSIKAAYVQLQYLRDQYDAFKSTNADRGFETTLLLPRPFGDPNLHREGMSAALSFPAIMIGIWIGLGVMQFGAFAVFAYLAIRP